MITISGVDVIRDNHSFPTLYDVGYSLSQVPRFNGYTTERYSVLHHLIGCWEYAMLKDYGDKVALYALIHDAHEAVTGDICPPWKTDDTKELQRQLDQRFYQSLGIGPPDGFTAVLLKQIDSQMVYAEAKAYAPQVAEHILKPGPNYRDSINPMDGAADEAVKYAKSYLGAFYFEPNICGNIYAELVTDAIQATKEKAHVF